MLQFTLEKKIPLISAPKHKFCNGPTNKHSCSAWIQFEHWFWRKFSVLMSLHWLPVHNHIQYKLLYTFKALHCIAPTYLEEQLVSTIKVTAVRELHDDYRTTFKDKKHMVIDVLIRQLPCFVITCQVKPRTNTPCNLCKKNVKTFLFRLGYYNFM